MPIIQTVDQHDFINAFRNMDRKENFSHEGLCELFEYYDRQSEDLAEPFELDVIAICCEWTESTVQEVINDYDETIGEYDADFDEDELQEYVCEQLEYCTTVIMLDNGNVLYINF